VLLPLSQGCSTICYIFSCEGQGSFVCFHDRHCASISIKCPCHTMLFTEGVCAKCPRTTFIPFLEVVWNHWRPWIPSNRMVYESSVVNFGVLGEKSWVVLLASSKATLYLQMNCGCSQNPRVQQEVECSGRTNHEGS
jgi:hypothetical protein